jgi:Serine acetyltransferase, N-terminal
LQRRARYLLVAARRNRRTITQGRPGQVAGYQLRTISNRQSTSGCFHGSLDTAATGSRRRFFARARPRAPNRSTFGDAVIHRISARLGNEIVPAYLIADVFAQAADRDEGIGAGFRADIMAVLDRDPACERLIEPFLYFKGFHAIQTHRLAHWLWTKGRADFALYLQSRSSDVFQTDIGACSRIAAGSVVLHPVPPTRPWRACQPVRWERRAAPNRRAA